MFYLACLALMATILLIKIFISFNVKRFRALCGFYAIGNKLLLLLLYMVWRKVEEGEEGQKELGKQILQIGRGLALQRV